MDALLILGGLLLIVAGLVWSVLLAFGTGLLWGVGSLFPPVGLLYVAQHWSVARKAVGLSGLGVIPLVIGFSLLASHDPERLAAIVSLRWLSPVEQESDQHLAIQLQGELDGRPFEPQVGVLTDGVLTLSEGDQLFARQEVNIRLGAVFSGAVNVDVLPQDADPAAQVEINWLQPGQTLPEARRISRGYTLHLDLEPVPPNRLKGDFHLVLPAHYHTSLSGRVELYTDDLRYRDGLIDLTHDSVGTLKYVAEQYLQRRFGTRTVSVTALSPVNFPAVALGLHIQADVKGSAKTVVLQLRKGDQGWAVIDGDRYPPLPAEISSQQDRPQNVMSVSPRQVSPRIASSVVPRRPFSLAQLLSDPARFERQPLRAFTRRGGVAEGLFVGLDQEGNLAIRRRLKGPGEATYNLAPEEIVRLERLEP